MTHTLRMTEQEIVKGCLANNRFAQKALYDKYKNAMFTLSYRIAGDFGLAEEILQDAFVKVFRGLDGFRFDSTLGAWIKTIVVRTAYSKLKRKIVFESELEPAQNMHFDWGTSLDTDYLEQAIMQLPEGYRTVFTLIEIEGYVHREVAELLGISEGTSKSQLFFAKKRLREYLNKLS